ncbi:MAG TPA: polymer-forming cytoskeletal protein [Hyphomicrobium sp.]|nr:polymer-forming cytoskeletal protein [Hyphomicrobium sp.]
MFTAWKTDNAFDLAPRPASAPGTRLESKDVMPAREAKDTSPANAPKEAYSIINEWLAMRGDLESDGDILVKGRVHGNLHCRILIVDKGAFVEGGVTADEVVIRGSARGTIRAKRIRLEKTAVVDCEIYHESFAAEEGARVNGSLHAQDEASAPPDLKPAAAFARLAEASVSELFSRHDSEPAAAKPSSALYHMLDVARAASGASDARKS